LQCRFCCDIQALLPRARDIPLISPQAVYRENHPVKVTHGAELRVTSSKLWIFFETAVFFRLAQNL
jgi:hypothetical protein